MAEGGGISEHFEAVLCRDDIDATEQSRLMNRVRKTVDRVELEDRFPSRVTVNVRITDYNRGPEDR